MIKGHPATNGAPGLDVLGKGTGVVRADGRAAPYHHDGYEVSDPPAASTVPTAIPSPLFDPP